MIRRVILQSLRRRWKLFGAQFLMLSACGGIVAVFVSLTGELNQAIQEWLQKRGTGDCLLFTKSLSKSQIQRLEKISPVLVLWGGGGWIRKKTVLWGVADYKRVRSLLPFWSLVGKWPESQKECVLGRLLARFFRLKQGDQLQFVFPSGKKISLKVVGILDSGDVGEHFIFLSKMWETPHFSLVYGQWGRKKEKLASFLEGFPPYEVRLQQEVVLGVRQVAKKMGVLVGMTSLVVFLLTSIGVLAFGAARVWGERVEFALMRALGGERHHFLKIFLSEMFWPGLLGGMVGFLLAKWSLSYFTWQLFRYSLSPSLWSFFASLSCSLGIALLGGWKSLQDLKQWEPSRLLKGE